MTTFQKPELCIYRQEQTGIIWNEKYYKGGQTISVEAPIDQIPIFVKAGAIIPATEPIQHTGEMRDDRIILKIYSGADNNFTLYQDEHNGYGYEKGEYSITKLKWSDKQRKLIIGKREGTYPGMPDKVEFIQDIIVSKNCMDSEISI